MESFLTWLQGLPLSIWVNESESIWAYPLILFLHTFGLALTGGSAAVILARILGVAGRRGQAGVSRHQAVAGATA